MKASPIFSLISGLGALLVSSTGLQATTINWGTYFNPSSYLFDSTGANLNDDFVFELGTFGSFTPTESNMSDWMAAWKPFDRATAPGSNGWNSSAGIVAHSATLETDLTTSNASLSQTNTFSPGELAYIWVYKGVFGDVNGGFEWALVTNNSSDGDVGDDWLMPVASGHIATSLDWRIEDATATPFGGLNDTDGPGDTTGSPSTSYILQTHTSVIPVPEPGSALLLGLAGLGFFTRRRARAAVKPMR